MTDGLGAETQAYIKKLVDQAPPLSDAQKRVITAAFRDQEREAGDGHG